MTTTTFAELGLAEPLLRALNDAQYTIPTPIQAKAIPVLLAGRDLLGLAETGTGKTAAFVLPMLQQIVAEGGRAQPGAPRALILAPTRELAIQIGESIHAYGRHVRVSHTVIFGGVGQRPQVNAIARGVDILVATPGRLLDLIEQRHLRLSEVRTFVLDEADRMLDMGFVRDVRRILKMVPTKRHSLLFSATMPDDIAKLAAEILKDPVRVEIARAGKTVDRIDQRVMFVNNAAKRDVLGRLLQDPEMRRVIVFTRTKRGADRVSKAIELIGVGVHAIHGNKSQGQRQSALDSFRKGFTRVLVATDIAARGIDIDEITHVVNYELPNIPESYVHRIGRTARAGASGVAIALCAPDEREYLRDIEKLTGRALTVVAAPGGLDRGAPRETAHEPAEAREPRDRAPERRPAPHRQARDGAHRQNGGQNGGQNGAHRSGSPRGGDRAEGGRPWRNDDRRPANGGSRDDRPGEGERRSHGKPRDGARDGAARGSAGGGMHPPRKPGHRNGAPHHGDGRRGGEAPRNGETRADAPQPWRNWTRDGDAERPRNNGAPRQESRVGAARDDAGKDRRPGRPPQGRSADRRGDGQGRGRAFR